MYELYNWGKDWKALAVLLTLRGDIEHRILHITVPKSQSTEIEIEKDNRQVIRSIVLSVSSIYWCWANL